MSLRSLTDEELLAIYGDPTPYVHPDGHVDQAWERSILTTIPLPGPLRLSFIPPRFTEAPFVKVIRCHRKIAKDLEHAFEALFNMPEVWATIGDFGGCYQWRTRRRQRKRLSKHAFGLAVDLDVADNPDGAEPNVHPATIETFERFGFLWGGRWAGDDRDGMHFERAVAA